MRKIKYPFLIIILTLSFAKTYGRVDNLPMDGNQPLHVHIHYHNRHWLADQMIFVMGAASMWIYNCLTSATEEISDLSISEPTNSEKIVFSQIEKMRKKLDAAQEIVNAAREAFEAAEEVVNQADNIFYADTTKDLLEITKKSAQETKQYAILAEVALNKLRKEFEIQVINEIKEEKAKALFAFSYIQLACAEDLKTLDDIQIAIETIQIAADLVINKAAEIPNNQLAQSIAEETDGFFQKAKQICLQN